MPLFYHCCQLPFVRTLLVSLEIFEILVLHIWLEAVAYMRMSLKPGIRLDSITGKLVFTTQEPLAHPL